MVTAIPPPRTYYDKICSSSAVYFIASLVLLSMAVLSSADTGVCDATTSPDDSSCEASPLSSIKGPLRPSDLPQPEVFTAFESNTTVTLQSGVEQTVAAGVVKQINNFENPDRDDSLADFAVLPAAVNRSSIEDLLRLLRDYNDWDDDPDTVDGMATHEMFVDNPTLYSDKNSAKYRDVDPNFVPTRRELRQKLSDVMTPYLDQVLTPIVRKRYPEACTSKGPTRLCTPCYSLIRKYKHGQRQSHATHRDGHALVTVVISLSDYGVDYRGGLYVASGFGQHEFMALNKGDAIMHQSSLLHGVKVFDLEWEPSKTERWSWILWYTDSISCDKDYGYEWFADCAETGDPLCQQLHSTKVGATPGISNAETSEQLLELNIQAADNGSGDAAVKIARAYLGLLPSALPFDVQKATEYYHKATLSHSPDGHYGMVQLLLMGVTSDYNGQSKDVQMSAWKDPRVNDAIKHLEMAAYAGHEFSQFNLGVVHTFGYHNGITNTDLAGKWFEESGLPEGYFIASLQAQASQDKNRELEMMQKAKEMGYFAPWRKEARGRTGSGGAGGVDLNLPWPPAFDGRFPPKF